MAKTANPTSALIWFIVITILYIVIDYSGVKKLSSNGQSSTVYMMIYALLVIVVEYIGNISLTNQLCGTNQYGTALSVTIIPWVFIFGSILILIRVFPGWLSPFSNTFGYAIAIAAGLNGTLNDILKPDIKGDGNITKDQEVMMEAITHIYSDKSMLVNEITPINFTSFWNGMKGIMKNEAINNKALQEKLFGLVVLKDTVARLVWYILAGTLVISVSYNYLANSGCQQSVRDMQKKHSAYEEKLANDAEEDKSETNKIYSTTE
jgi:hypothetical protein